MSESIEERLKNLGLDLPAAPAAVGAYVPVTQFGNVVVTSGQLPFVGKELAFKGKIGGPLSVEQGAEAARVAAINALAQIKSAIGSLDRVEQVVRLEGYVNSAIGFQQQAAVMNGASNLMVDVFGDAGRHTRLAVGAAELPLDAAVEIVVWVIVKSSSLSLNHTNHPPLT